MPVIQSFGLEQPVTVAESRSRTLFFSLFFGLGGGLLFAIICLVLIYVRCVRTGRIRLAAGLRPGQLDDEQRLLEEETAVMGLMDESQRIAYFRAKEFQERYPPESVHTEITLSQFLTIQEKGVSAWEFSTVDLEQSNAIEVQSRTEINFLDDDAEASIQTNLPVPKQNEVYYWEAKLHDMPESTIVSIGMTTKPYPVFRLPGWNKHSLAYTSQGQKRFSYPFPRTLLQTMTPELPTFHEGDVVGVAFRPRTGSIFFTRNGKRLEETIHPSFKTLNLFPTIGTTGAAAVHVNFGQAGFVFIEANVKKWGLAPVSGTLAPPPRYGKEDESILLEAGSAQIRVGPAQTPKYSRQSPGLGHTRGQTSTSRSRAVSVASGTGSAAGERRRRERQPSQHSDISLASYPNSPPGYSDVSGEEVDSGDNENGIGIENGIRSSGLRSENGDEVPLMR